MQYITAALGAIFMFLAIILIGCVVNAFLPPALQQKITIPLLVFSIWGTPALLVGIVLGAIAALHSFRSTLKRYAIKAEKSRLPVGSG
jgi:hypothetical protein